MKRRSTLAQAFSLLLTAILIGLGTSSPGLAENAEEAIFPCDSRSTIIADLEKSYSEKPMALGVTSAGTVIELWTAIGGQTWTLLVTLSNGNSCIVGAGDDWTSLKKTAKGRIH